MAKPTVDGENLPYTHHLSPADRAWVRDRADAKGISIAAVARAAGMSRQNLYQLLDGTIGKTEHWHAIVAAVGGTPPSGVPPIVDARLATIVRHWPDLTEDDKVTIERLARRLYTKKS